jgi:tartrate-resistant acid phosphatase type 5
VTWFAAALLAYRIAVVGDVGDGTAQVAKGIAALAPFDAIILTGDNFYPCGVKSTGDPKWSVMGPLLKLDIPIYPVLGNHDHCGKPDAQINARLPNWKFPSREYTISTPFANIQFIDTTPFVHGKPAPTIATQPGVWNIVVGHHPLLSSGYHGRFPRDEHERMMTLMPVMKDVDLYIAGHDHHLELLEGKPRMLVSGAGSDPIPAILRHRATRWVSEERYRGFAVLELTAKTMTITFYDAAGVAKSHPFKYSR